MTRIKRGTMSLKKRRSVLKAVKGFRGQRSKKERAAKDALRHAGAYAFAHRRDKKGVMRRLWNVRINAALRAEGMTYSKFINALKVKGVTLDRKVLSEMAQNNAAAFSKVIAFVK